MSNLLWGSWRELSRLNRLRGTEQVLVTLVCSSDPGSTGVFSERDLEPWARSDVEVPARPPL